MFYRRCRKQTQPTLKPRELFGIQQFVAVLRHKLHCARCVVACQCMFQRQFKSIMRCVPGAGAAMQRFDLLGVSLPVSRRRSNAWNKWW